MGIWGDRDYKRSQTLGIYKHKETGKYTVSIKSNYLGNYDGLCEAVKVAKKFREDRPKDVRAWKIKNTKVTPYLEDSILEEVDLGTLPQREVAERLGITQSSISYKVNGEVKWSKKELETVKKMISEESEAKHYFRKLNETVERGFNRIKARLMGFSDVEINAIFNK